MKIETIGLIGAAAAALLYAARIWAAVVRPALETQKESAASMERITVTLESLTEEVKQIRRRQEETCNRLGKLEVHVDRNRETLLKINGFKK